MTLDARALAAAEEQCSFVDGAPSPFHVAAQVAARLVVSGYTVLDEAQAWPSAPGRYLTVRGGSVIAWSTLAATGPTTPFRIVAGHTDSPNLRVKQHADAARFGWQVVNLEAYGGALLNSWLDRDLGLSGRVTVRDRGARHGLREELLRVDEPVLRVPQLAIHLADDRAGVTLDRQRHLDAVWGIGGAPRSLVGFAAERLDVDAGDILGWELMTHDVVPSRLVGADGDMLSAPRLDNQGPATPACGPCSRPRPTRVRSRAWCRCWCCSTTRRSAACPNGAPSATCCAACWSGSCSSPAATARRFCGPSRRRSAPRGHGHTPRTPTTGAARAHHRIEVGGGRC
jgi:aspartyl aminopeptidase